MSLQRQVVFWVAALVLFGVWVYVLRDILLPFVVGLALAYFLDPVADRLERLGIGRLGATLVIVLVFTLLLVAFVVVLAPALINQLGGFALRLPDYLAALQELVAELSDGRLADWLGVDQAAIARPMEDLAGNLAQWLTGLARSLVSGGVALVTFLSLFIVTPVVAFYMLADWDRMIRIVDGWLPRDHAPAIRALARDIDTVIAGFVRGQGTLCLILGAYYALGLTVIGLNFGLLIGVTAGLVSFIPFVGSLLGLVVGGGVALVQFWPEWPLVAAVIGLFLFGQFVEGYILQPYLVGSSVGLHPVWLMFALFAFGYLFGFVGLLLAVPLAAAMGVLARFAIQQYLASPLYASSDKTAQRGGEGRGE